MSRPNSPIARTRVILFGIMLQGLILLVGCGGKQSSATGIPVSGKVTVEGIPLISGNVHYEPDDTKGNTFNKEVAGRIKADGTYSLHYSDSNGKSVGGAPPGWYKVIITPELAAAGPEGKVQKAEEFNPMYRTSKKSKLTVEVKENAPPGAYDFQLTK